MAEAPAGQVKTHRKLAPVLPAALFLLLLSCSPLGHSREKVEFLSEDGFRLDGRLVGDGAKGVVLAHSHDSDQHSWAPFAARLADDGYKVLTFDFRGYGDSQGRRDIELIHRDVAGAARYLAGTGAGTIVLVGASMGGTASLVAAERVPVAGVAALSAPAKFSGLDASAIAEKITVPMFFAAATGDGEAADDAERLFRAAGDPTADLKLVPGESHGTGMLRGKTGKLVEPELTKFIDRVSK